MISRTRKKTNESESDSDWDSLPGDVSVTISSPEPNIKTAAKLSHSPVPPKQRNTNSPGKHGTTKPGNIYKGTMNSSKTSGNATTFEDKSGGVWDDDKENIQVGSFSKRNNNKNDKVVKEKKERNSQQQDSEKKPPFSDFHDALTTPIPPSQNRNDYHSQAGVNKAYRIENDVLTTTHDSWDESEIETFTQLPETHEHEKESEEVLGMKNEHTVNRSPVQKEKPKRNKKDKTEKNRDFQLPVLDLVQQHPNSENCCFIEVTEGAHDNRYRPAFYHGSKNHFHIREDDPRATITGIAEKSEVILQRVWRELFGILQIFLNFIMIFILELFKVFVYTLRYFITGVLYIIGDQFIKPLLSAIFNNIIQPFSILLLNIFTIITNLLKPILSLTKEMFSQIAIPLKAFRLFELNWDHRNRRNNEGTDIKVV